MSQVVDVDEEFPIQLREVDKGDGTVLVDGTSIALKTRSEVSYMSSKLLNHHTPGT